MPVKSYAAIVAMLMIATPSQSVADAGTGSLPHDDWSVVRQSHASPLHIGADAVRFSATPSLGGRAIIIELHAEGAQAVGSATFFGGHPSVGNWEQLGFLRLNISAQEFSSLIRQIDTLVTAGEPNTASARLEDIVICTDGSRLTTELSHGGVVRWLTGRTCGAPHPNDAIADILGPIVETEMARYHLH
jgi:hypothetical protein